MPQTPIYALPYPASTDTADVPRDIQALAARLDTLLPGVGTPTGGGIDWYALAPPAGFLLCDGSAVSRTSFAKLFAVLGTTWGAGDGSSTFNLPDTRGRVIVGVAPGGHADVASLGLSDGNALATRRPRHAHNVYEPVHGHAVADPTHAHGVADPSHTHSVNDPWHAHTIAAGPNGQPVGGSSADWQDNQGQRSTNAAATNIWLSASGTGIGIYGAATGVQVVGNTIGITVGVASGGTDAPSYVVAGKAIKT